MRIGLVNSTGFFINNPSPTADLNTTVSDDGKTITFISTGNGYDNATYTLVVKIDTIQYDQAHNVW